MSPEADAMLEVAAAEAARVLAGLAVGRVAEVVEAHFEQYASSFFFIHCGCGEGFHSAQQYRAHVAAAIVAALSAHPKPEQDPRAVVVGLSYDESFRLRLADALHGQGLALLRSDKVGNALRAALDPPP